MNRIVPLSLLPLLFLGFAAYEFHSNGEETIESVTANPAYNTVRPVADAGYAEYHSQVAGRLEYLEGLLRGRDVSRWPAELQAARALNIERLHEYRLAGNFPINYDYPDRQFPCFLDRDGNLCAVANLIAKSDGIDAVRRINDRYQYATVSEMRMPEVDAWIARSGLTREEVITIQEPAFTIDGRPDPSPLYRQMLAEPVPLDTLKSLPAPDTTGGAAGNVEQ